MSTILGISAFYHDSAATLIKNGKIISAVQEEDSQGSNMTPVILKIY